MAQSIEKLPRSGIDSGSVATGKVDPNTLAAKSKIVRGRVVVGSRRFARIPGIRGNPGSPSVSEKPNRY